MPLLSKLLDLFSLFCSFIYKRFPLLNIINHHDFVLFIEKQIHFWKGNSFFPVRRQSCLWCSPHTNLNINFTLCKLDPAALDIKYSVKKLSDSLDLTDCLMPSERRGRVKFCFNAGNRQLNCIVTYSFSLRKLILTWDWHVVGSMSTEDFYSKWAC